MEVAEFVVRLVSTSAIERGRSGNNEWMTTGSRVVDALKPPTPDLGAVARGLIGVLAMALLALTIDSGAAAVWAAAAGVVCVLVMRSPPRP